jgi:hypothetical protein
MNIIRLSSTPCALPRGSSFCHKTCYRLSSSSHKSSPSSSSSTAADQLHGHLKDSTKYVTGTFISSFADSLAFYLVTFSVVGVGCYFASSYVIKSFKKPFQRSRDRFDEKKKQLTDTASGVIGQIQDLKDQAGEMIGSSLGTMNEKKDRAFEGAGAMKEKMKGSLEIFKRPSKGAEGESETSLGATPAPVSDSSDDRAPASPKESLRAKAEAAKEKMRESLGLGSRQSREREEGDTKESLRAKVASWGKGILQMPSEKKGSDQEPEEK